MTDLATQQGAIIVHDQDGKEYILIPRESVAPKQNSQIERINEALDSWQNEPGDADWWAEFRQFLRENPLAFNEPRLPSDDE